MVLERDHGTCQQCGKTNKETRIVVHHIDHNHDHNWLDNMIALCHPDNVRAEGRKYKRQWEVKFKRYTSRAIYKVME